MCSGVGCAQAAKCYRATATPCEPRQSYFAEPPFDTDGTCSFFYPNYARLVTNADSQDR